MRYIFIAFGLILCNLIISNSVAATSKHGEWFKQLERVQGRDPGSEGVNKDRLLSQLIKSPTDAPAPSFFELLSRSNLRFYYTRNNAFIHSKLEDITVDIYPFGDCIQVRFWNHKLDSNGARQYAVAQLGGDYVVDARWLNLDSDSETEFICISRSGGTGPYYYSIIIDSSKDVFSFRLFYSAGRPRIDSKRQIIGIGKFKNGYRGASTEFIYTDYVWDNGLRLSSNGR